MSENVRGVQREKEKREKNEREILRERNKENKPSPLRERSEVALGAKLAQQMCVLNGVLRIHTVW